MAETNKNDKWGNGKWVEPAVKGVISFLILVVIAAMGIYLK